MANHIYSYESNISAPAADVFAYHERFAALQRLIPPWDQCVLFQTMEAFRMVIVKLSG